MRPILLLTTLLAAAALLLACSGGDDDTIDIGDGEINVSDDLPDDFPDDFPQYDGAEVLGSVTGTADGNEGTLVTFQTDDSLEDVEAYYEGEFEDGPWQQVSNSSSSQGGSFLVEKGNTAASVIFAEADGKTSILVTYGDKDDLGLDDDGGDGAGDDDGSSADDDAATVEPDSSSDDDGGSSDGDGDDASGSTDLPEEVDLEDDFPSNIPLPDGARVTSSSAITSGGFSTIFAELYVEESIDDLQTYFEDTLVDAGYTESISSSANGQVFLSYAEGDGSSGNTVLVNISDSAVDGYSLVTVTVSASGE